MADIVDRLNQYRTLPLIGRGHRGRLIQASMRDAADEIVRLRAALKKIANPVAYFQEYAKSQERQVDGAMAIQIANNPHWLQKEAAAALSSTEQQTTTTKGD